MDLNMYLRRRKLKRRGDWRKGGGEGNEEGQCLCLRRKGKRKRVERRARKEEVLDKRTGEEKRTYAS